MPHDIVYSRPDMLCFIESIYYLPVPCWGCMYEDSLIRVLWIHVLSTANTRYQHENQHIDHFAL